VFQFVGSVEHVFQLVLRNHAAKLQIVSESPKLLYEFLLPHILLMFVFAASVGQEAAVICGSA
jgi:hypothetical protein